MRQVRAAQQVQVEIDKPIGLNFKKSSAKGGGLVVTVSLRGMTPQCRRCDTCFRAARGVQAKRAPGS